jgi:hypothetical protein
MGVSDLAELRRTLRRTDTGISSSLRESNLSSAFRISQKRISEDLRFKGSATVRDSKGNTFVIERKKA